MNPHDEWLCHFAMIIDLLKMKQEGLLSDEFSFEYSAPEELIISLPEAKFEGLVAVNAFVSLDGKDVYADIDLSYRISCSCSRCLEHAEEVVNHSFSVKFSLYEEEDAYLYKSGKVDLTSCVNEAIIISQPTVIYCKEDCKGLCPVCGANLNQTDCGHGNN